MRCHGGMAVFSSDLYFPLGSTEIAPLTSFQSSPLTLTGFFLIAQLHLTVYSGPFQNFHHQKIETFHQSWFIKRIQKKKERGWGKCIPECLQFHLTGFSVSAADIQDLTFSLRLRWVIFLSNEDLVFASLFKNVSNQTWIQTQLGSLLFSSAVQLYWKCSDRLSLSFSLQVLSHRSKLSYWKKKPRVDCEPGKFSPLCLFFIF